MAERDYKQLKTELLTWAEAHPRSLPWRKTKNPYKICVAEVMLRQTSAAKVAPTYEDFVAKYPDLIKLSKAKLKSVEKIIYPLGLLYRGSQLREMAKVVVKKHGGSMPTDENGLKSLPGVGDYTASAILCFAYGQQIPIIDTNVVRFYTRYFGLTRRLPSSAPNGEIRDIARRALPIGHAREYNYAILDFAAAICKHYSPKCNGCPLGESCNYQTDIKAVV